MVEELPENDSFQFYHPTDSIEIFPIDNVTSLMLIENKTEY